MINQSPVKQQSVEESAKDFQQRTEIAGVQDITIQALTFNPDATGIATCCVCGVQRDVAVADGWREINVAGRISYACADEFTSVYQDQARFRDELTFAAICAANDFMIELGLPPLPEAEAMRSKIREARGRGC